MLVAINHYHLHSGQTLAERNRAMIRAHLRYGYFQQEIAGQTGLHYSTVSRITLRERKKKNSKIEPALIVIPP